MIFLFAACWEGGSSDEPSSASSPAATGCDAEPFEDLRTLCRVQQASTAARARDITTANAACTAITEADWAEECWFRSGEELGAAGLIPPAMEACSKAGRYRSFCVTHAGWRAPPTDDPLTAWLAAADMLPEPQRAEARALLPGRWWFNRFYGTGRADPAGVDSAEARTGWALEAVRLTDGDVEAARRAFKDKQVLTGTPLAPDRKIGRYDLGIRIAGEAELPHVPVFGGGARLVGSTDEEDLDIALLEAAYFREATNSSTFRAALDDPRQRVRWTAIRLFRILPSPDAEQIMTRLTSDADPVVQAHAKDALKFRTWEGKPNAPGLRRARPTAPAAPATSP